MQFLFGSRMFDWIVPLIRNIIVRSALNKFSVSDLSKIQAIMCSDRARQLDLSRHPNRLFEIVWIFIDFLEMFLSKCLKQNQRIVFFFLLLSKSLIPLLQS